ncbi:MAG TPA: glycosyltransferase family 39 protein [Anaerolineales bacterium]|jgi:hypothetical protein
MQKTNSLRPWLIAGLLLLILPTHLAGIDKFATIDEPWWVISGSNYYYALTHRDFADTIYDYHPAVTTTWVVTGGMLTTFPEYRGFGQGYFDVRKPNFENFMREHGQPILGLLRNSRLIQAALIIFLSLLSFFLLRKLVEPSSAFLAIVLAVDAPYFLGHSRLLNHEGMLAMFVLVSLLGMLVYLRERKLVYLLISGAAFGLAQLTKSSSIVAAGVVGLMLFVSLLDKERSKPLKASALESLKMLGIWLAVAAAVYVILWPGMWVAPGKMLYEVYGNAFSYAFQGARLEALPNGATARVGLNLNASGVLAYLRQWLLRSTPISWLGVLLAIPAMLNRAVRPALKWLIGYLAITAFLFILLFGIAQGRDSPHYILTSFICLDVIAGLGWGYGLSWSAERWDVLKPARGRAVAIAVLLLLQIAATLPFYPYYYTYENPVVAAIRGSQPYGYGEGLELAAAYLAAKQDSEATRAFVYAGMGPFSFFYPGETEVFKKIYLTEPGLPSIVQGMRRSDYLVVYSAVQDRLPESADFLHAIAAVEPEKEITIRGVVVARIYEIADIPESVYDEMEKR